MRKSVILMSCCTVLLSSNAMAAPSAAIPPILIGTPTAAQINQRCAMFVSRSTAMRSELEKSKGTATVATTLAAYDKLIEALNDGQGEAGFYRQVSPTAASREAAEKCEVRMASEFTKLSLSRPIYERIKAIAPPADEPTKLYLTRTLGAFERAGIALDDAGRAKAQALGDDVSKLTTEFEANIPKGQRTIIVTPAELDGVPQDFIAAHKPGADGKITLKTDYTDYLPVMTYAKSGDVRQRFYREYQLRAYPANDEVLRQPDRQARRAGEAGRAPELRDAQLRGPDAQHAGQGPGADGRYGVGGEAGRGSRLCQEARAASAAAAGRNQTGAVGQRLRLQPRPKTILWLRYAGGAEVFRLRSMCATEFSSSPRTCSASTSGRGRRPKWDKLAESYEVYDHGKLIGRFYFDAHPRPGKYEHANAVPLRSALARQVPVGALVFNVPKA